VKGLLAGLQLHTVCQSAHCPNHAECWGQRTATFMVLGRVCTRCCTFCAVNGGHPEAVDPEEPEKVAEAVKRLGLRHAVITSVTRDDLPDGGSAHIARTVTAVRMRNPGTTVEVVVQDFKGDPQAIARVVEAEPDIFGHNIETVARLHPVLRDWRFRYTRSLETLRLAASHANETCVKSAFLLGCGENDAEIRQTLEDLLDAGCIAVCMGQYLQPTARHHAVARFVTPAEFAAYEELAYALGFAFAVAGPLVRSSYRSGELLQHIAPRKTGGNASHAI